MIIRHFDMISHLFSVRLIRFFTERTRRKWYLGRWFLPSGPGRNSRLVSRSALGEFRDDIFFERNFGRGNIRNSTDRILNRDEVSWHLFKFDKFYMWFKLYTIQSNNWAINGYRTVYKNTLHLHASHGAPDEVLSTAFACLCFLLGLCTFTCCYLDLPA